MTAIARAPRPEAEAAAYEAPVAAPTRRRNRFISAGSTVAWLYLTVLGALVAWVVAAAVLFGWSPTVVSSASMEPGIRPGDVVLVSPVGEQPLSVGSVIVYDSPLGRTVHRVSGVEDDTYRTRGDANTTDDPDVVPADRVVGGGRLLVPFVGLPVHWLRSGQAGMTLLFSVSVLVSVGLAVGQSRRRA